MSERLLFAEDKYFLECHASTVLPLEDGTVLVVYFAGDYERADNVAIWLSRRIDGVWQPPRKIAKVNETAHWNPVIFESDGKIRVAFRVGSTIVGWKTYSVTSEDKGETWSAPVKYAVPDDVCGPVRNKPIITSEGLMLAPNSIETHEAWHLRIDISSDGGETFFESAPIPVNRTDATKPNYMRGPGGIQPTLWESASGCIHALLRTRENHIFRSDSTDGGRTWCEAYPTELPGNSSGIDLANVQGALYLAFNPTGQDWRNRTPLEIWKSTDNGMTFTPFMVLEDMEMDPRNVLAPGQVDQEGRNKSAEFSYPAIVYRNEKLYVTYTYLRRSIGYREIDIG